LPGERAVLRIRNDRSTVFLTRYDAGKPVFVGWLAIPAGRQKRHLPTIGARQKPHSIIDRMSTS
jgi:hypothetical protein